MQKKNSIKVMFINPPQKFYGESLGFNVYFPLGLLWLAAMIKDLCDVKIYDCLIEHFEIKKEDNYTLYGTPYSKIKEDIENYNPDIVGITIPFSSQSENAKIVSSICKEINPNITVVIGGPHASIRYEQLLKDNACDYCVIREGEKTFFEFIKGFIAHEQLNEIKGIASNVNNKIKYIPREDLIDLDELPLPAYDLINYKKYLNNPYLYKSRSSIGPGSISMITSRGCPFNCVFCSIKGHMGKKFRYHSPEYVLKHIRFIIDHMGIKRFHFEDDNISLNKQRFEKILDNIIESSIDISWDTPNGIRADTLDYNILKKIKESGNSSLQVAIESGNQRVLDTIIKKSSSLEEVIKITGYCNDLNIPLRAFYVIGFPGETLPDIQDTLNLALKLFKEQKVFPIILFATPLYGTELYNECLAKEYIKETFTDKELAQATQFYGEPLISTKDFSNEDLKRLGKNFEEEMNKLINGASFRQILTDKNTLFANLKS